MFYSDFTPCAHAIVNGHSVHFIAQVTVPAHDDIIITLQGVDCNGLNVTAPLMMEAFDVNSGTFADVIAFIEGMTSYTLACFIERALWHLPVDVDSTDSMAFCDVAYVNLLDLFKQSGYETGHQMPLWALSEL